MQEMQNLLHTLFNKLKCFLYSDEIVIIVHHDS